MFIRVIRQQQLRRGGEMAVLTAAAVLCLYRPQALATGISRGLSVCSQVIIPTLYPFMLLAGVLTDSSFCRRPGRAVSVLTRRLFGLPGCCGPAVLLSLVGGYPAGALAIGRLWRQGQITQQQARRMTRFCINGGPGFIISTVGGGLLGSVRAGLLLFAAHAGVSVVMGLWLARGHRGSVDVSPARPTTPSRAPTQIVADTCLSLITMCGFVVLAAAILSLAESLGLPLMLQHLTRWPSAGFSAALAGVLEVSCGCIACAGAGELAPLWLSLCLGWGGLSVQGQLAAALGDASLLDSGFFLWRLLHGTISGAVALLLFRLIPAELPAGAQALAPGVAALPHAATAAASGMLLGLSFFAMLCFSPKNTGKTQ